MAYMSEKTPVTIFTGFLGSGKTTIISHLVDELQKNGQQVAYIKNEIGEKDLDAQMLQKQHIKAKELLNGCICCTLTGPFLSAMDEIIDTYNPDRIIIEASGTADAAALALMINTSNRVSRDGIISVVDVLNFEGFVDLSQTARNQTQFTDIILFNKVELADLERKRTVLGYVRELNTTSPIIETQEGRIASEVIFGINPKHLDQELTLAQTHHDHEHLEQDHIQAVSLYFASAVLIDEVKELISKLPENVFRAKGIAQDSDGKVWVVQKVGTRVTAELFHNGEFSEFFLILIGFNVLTNLEEIKKILASVTLQKNV